jgi:hypothetical protein
VRQRVEVRAISAACLAACVQQCDKEPLDRPSAVSCVASQRALAWHSHERLAGTHAVMGDKETAKAGLRSRFARADVAARGDKPVDQFAHGPAEPAAQGRWRKAGPRRVSTTGANRQRIGAAAQRLNSASGGAQ